MSYSYTNPETSKAPASDSVTISVIAPCLNEAKNLPELTSRLLNVFSRKNLNGEVVLVNDGSTDDTGEVMESIAARHANVRVVHHKVNKGIAQAWKSGVANAAGEYVCLIDADLQNLPEDVWRLYREIKLTNVDLVQGYRSTVGRLKDSRYILSRGFNIMLNLAFGMRLRDNKSGFVIAAKETLRNILLHRYNYYYFNSFITVSALARGCTVREIETLFESRLLGQSYLARFPLKAVLRSFIDIVKAFLEFRLFCKNENILADFLRSNKTSRADPPLPALRSLWFKVFCWTMPLHKWMIRRKAKSYYEELKQSQWLSLSQIKELQEWKLRYLVQHAYYHVAYYRQRFDDLGLKPNAIRCIEDLQKLPLLSKDAVRENLYFDLLSDNHNKRQILKVSTSGSTGEPFVCYADKHQLEIRWAATLRSLEWTGYRFGDRQARLWHQTLGMSWSQVLRERLDAWFNNRLFIPAFELSDKNIREFVEKLKRFNPVLIDGYAESFNFLALYIKEHGLEGIHPKGIVSSAQALPDPSRKIIEEAFGCGAYDKYGSREFSGIAYECAAHDGHHIVAESYIVEILKDGRPAKPGELGEVVITDLNNFCMPLLRYRVGDLAVAMDNTVPCACGRGLPRLGRIEGRVQAIIVGSNGNYLPGTFFAHLFKDYDHVVRQYQVIQEQPGSMTLMVIKGPRFDEGAFSELLALLRQYLGSDMGIDVQFVTHIAMVRTGKQQGSISKLALDFQKIRDWRSPAQSAGASHIEQPRAGNE